MLYIVNNETKHVYWRKDFSMQAMEEASFWIASRNCKEVRRKQGWNNYYIFIRESGQAGRRVYQVPRP